MEWFSSTVLVLHVFLQCCRKVEHLETLGAGHGLEFRWPRVLVAKCGLVKFEVLDPGEGCQTDCTLVRPLTRVLPHMGF